MIRDIAQTRRLTATTAARRAPRVLYALRGIALALSLSLAACAVTTPVPVGEKRTEKSEVQRMYATVLDNVHNMYLDAYSVERLAQASLSGLVKLEPAATVESRDKRVSLLINGTSVGVVEKPEPNDTDGWARAIDRLIVAGRKVSTRLADADNEKVYKVTIDSLLDGLDRYSRYDGKQAGRRNRESREGFGGIGVSVVAHDYGVEVRSVTPNLPADRAGVVAGDVFVRIDGTTLRGATLRHSVRLLRGPLGKPVQVTIQREASPDSFVLTISRTRIIPTTVHYEPKDRHAYLRVSGFNQDTTAELRDGVERAVREYGKNLNGLIIDLRGNPGGLLDQAVSTADLFLREGRISTTRGRHPDSLQLFDASMNEIAPEVPLVVLMDGASASASEVLAAALQDSGRAVVVGSSSFGKGTVQTVIRLPNDGELILTWARLHAPSGYALNRAGVVPTLCTSSARDTATVLKRAFAARTARRQIAAREPRDDTTRESLGKLCPWQPHRGEDIDIAVAKRILEKQELYRHALRHSAPSAGG